MSSSLADLQKERGFPHPSRKKKLLKFKRESTRCRRVFLSISSLLLSKSLVRMNSLRDANEVREEPCAGGSAGSGTTSVLRSA
jgi:hypothetical protein